MPGRLVLDIINTIAADSEQNNTVSVLPLMCGTGKSTAISYKIRETIENASASGYGLLVVTDRIDRMDDYMHPHDEDLCCFLDNHDNQVCIMTSENIETTIKSQYYKPVLMMTTQRFFRLSVSEINHYLKWESGKRPVVIIDEYPELMTVVETDARKLAESIVAVDNSFPDGIYIKPIAELELTKKYYEEFVSQIRTGECGARDSIRCFWSWQTEENLRKDYEFVKRFDTFYKRLCQERATINRYGGGTYYDDIFTRIRAVRQLKNANAMIRQRKYARNAFDDSMLILLDNYELIHDIDAKVIILDGTANLSPQYLSGRYSFYPLPSVQRSLQHLHIKLINYPTGKTSLASSKEKQEQLLDYVELYFNEIITGGHKIPEDQYAIFTYMDIERAFKKRFGKSNVEHFGNIKGKNDFRDARHIIQIGLNRYPDEIYYLLYLIQNPEIAKEFKNMEEAYQFAQVPAESIDWDNLPEGETYTGELTTIKEGINQEEVIAQSDEIEAQMKDCNGETREIMNRILLAEIEQNLFRGIIRNTDSTDDFTFHLFINTDNYADLIQMMKERYEPCGAKIEFAQLPKAEPLLRIMNRKGQSYAKRYIEWHDKRLNVGEEYTPELVREGIGMNNQAAIQSYQLMLHKNPAIRILMSEEKIRYGVYRKKRNWHFE